MNLSWSLADTSDVNYVSDVNSDVFLSSTWVSDGCFLWMNLVFALHGASREADTSTAPEITNVASIFGRGGPLFNTHLDAYFYSFAEYFWAYWFLSSILFFFLKKKNRKTASSLITLSCKPYPHRLLHPRRWNPAWFCPSQLETKVLHSGETQKRMLLLTVSALILLFNVGRKELINAAEEKQGKASKKGWLWTFKGICMYSISGRSFYCESALATVEACLVKQFCCGQEWFLL